ncbi:uncharacterized protein LOC116190310 [Punica granatum]|uniref:Uncharacterized protein LOC116190310 n=1 Tax=Punica granatum TaxID=22663 RepID=A0A6P8BXS4_PUNGR|nr:uncharacterized protein LOC116190310 [Punica granatum]
MAYPVIELSQNCDVSCFVCTEDLHGSTYCCLDCDIYLHESCVGLPLQIRHPSHSEHCLTLSRSRRSDLYRCNGCSKSSGKSFIYCCDDCMFTLDIACAVSTLPPPEGHREEETIQHFAHDHRLTFFNMDRAIKIMCRLCEQLISGPTYGCGGCFFLLHESCVQLPREIPQHPFHNYGHAVILVTDTKEVFLCKACKQYHQFAYRCDGCALNLGVQCAVSTLPLQDQQKEDSQTIQHIFHSHKLTYFCLEMDNDIQCKACDLNISGEIYGCLECIFFLHKSCAELPQVMVHPLHPHPLYLEAKPLQCRCCYRNSLGFVYSCQNCRPFGLDLECTQKTLSAFKEGLPAEIHHTLHPHALALHNFAGPGFVLCKVCQHPLQGLGYSCPYPGEFFELHILCAELPLELEHPCHPKHPLTLLPAASNGRSFNCGACHRESKGCAFFCAECQFYLDASCAAQKLTFKHQLHEHSLTYFQRTKYLQCNRCSNNCNMDLYRCVECNFNLHHDCAPLPPSVKHELHFHLLLLCDRVVDEFYKEQYCDLCEMPRNPEHGVYYCEECNCAAHIDCAIPKVESKGGKEAVQNPLLDELNEEITRLEVNVEEMKRKLEALKRKRAKMSSLSLIFEVGGTKHRASKMELPVYPSEKTLKALLDVRTSNVLRFCYGPSWFLLSRKYFTDLFLNVFQTADAAAGGSSHRSHA